LLVVLAITAAQLLGTAAAVSDVDIWQLLRVAFPAAPPLAALTMALYAGLLGATGVGTVGPKLFKVEFLPPPQAPVDCRELARRTGLYLTNQLRAFVGGSDSATSSPVEA
jgi:hypothetical protein